MKGQGFYLPDILPDAKKVRTFSPYRGAMAGAIRAVKFKRVKPLLAVLGNCIREDLQHFVDEVKADLITYVPVHFFRWYSRGFDQNREILISAGIKPEKLLRRVKHSQPLAGLGRIERTRRIDGSFRLTDGKEVRGKRILVFDDVMTTGSTAGEVLKTLKEAGAGEVYFYFLAVEY